MRQQAFEIITARQEGPHKWIIAGRAHADIRSSDSLASSWEGPPRLRVVGIVTYGRSTDLLSTMMTGTLTLDGEMHQAENEPRFLYAV